MSKITNQDAERVLRGDDVDHLASSFEPIGDWRYAPNGNNWFDLKREFRDADWPADTAIYAVAPSTEAQ